MRTKEHYEKHLAEFYSWMMGDLKTKSTEFESLLASHSIKPANNAVAIDLGAGNVIQSFALKNLGYDVTAIDFNEQLLNELRSNPQATDIKTELADITNVSEFEHLQPELIVCCGDTLPHLDSKGQIEKLISDSSKILTIGGYLILTFRDYTNELTDQQRFIPVKSSNDRILTCILEYQVDKVSITDLLNEKIDGRWIQKVSTYEKVRIQPSEICQMLQRNEMVIKVDEHIHRMHTIIAQKLA